MTFIIHIGPPKTGTTSIQDCLLNNSLKENLQKFNTFYFYNSTSNNDVLFFLAHINSYIPRKYAQEKSISLEIHKEDAKNYIKNIKHTHKKNRIYISSSEYLFRLNRDEIIKLKDLISELDEDIKIFCYIRDPLKYMISLMCMNMNHSIKLRTPALDINILDQISLWEEIFKDRFTIYNFEKAVTESDGLIGALERNINELAFLNKKSSGIKLIHNKEKSNISECSELLLALRKYRIKHNIEDDKVDRDLMRAKREITKRVNKLKNYLGTKMEYSEDAKILFFNKNKSLYELLENKYKFIYLYNWRDYLDEEKYLSLKNIKWEFENIIKSYNKDLSELYLINLEMIILKNRKYNNSKKKGPKKLVSLKSKKYSNKFLIFLRKTFINPLKSFKYIYSMIKN